LYRLLNRLQVAHAFLMRAWCHLERVQEAAVWQKRVDQLHVLHAVGECG